VALIFIILALLGFGVFGAGSGSSGTGSDQKALPPQKAQPKHHVNCKARMGSGESHRNGCGGPPANP
jgi:hypothetical protein